MRRTYRIGDTTLGLRATADWFGDWLDETLGPYRRRRSEYPVYSVVLGDGNGEGPGRGRRLHSLYWGTTVLVRTLHLSTLGEVLLSELASHSCPGRDDAIYTSGGLVRSGRVAALVPWWTVATLAGLGRRPERAGVMLPSATWVAVDPATGRVVPRWPMLEVPPDAVDRLAGVDASAGAADRAVVGRPIRVAAVCTYGEGVEGLEPVSRGVALHRLAASTLNLGAVGGRALAGLGRLVATANTYELGAQRRGQLLSSLVGLFERERGRSNGGRRRRGGR